MVCALHHHISCSYQATQYAGANCTRLGLPTEKNELPLPDMQVVEWECSTDNENRAVSYQKGSFVDEETPAGKKKVRCGYALREGSRMLAAHEPRYDSSCSGVQLGVRHTGDGKGIVLSEVTPYRVSVQSHQRRRP